jgi:hypothetical protein
MRIRGAVGYLPWCLTGTQKAWRASFSQHPLEPDEIADTLTYRDRCGCTGDLDIFDVIDTLGQGHVYECPSCRASWVVGHA